MTSVGKSTHDILMEVKLLPIRNPTLERDGWSAPRPNLFISRQEKLYSFYKKMGRSQTKFGGVWISSTTQGFDPRAVEPTARRYTAYAILASSYEQWDVSKYFRQNYR